MVCCCLEFKPNAIVYYQQVAIDEYFASSDTGEVYVKNVDNLYEEDFTSKDLVYVLR